MKKRLALVVEDDPELQTAMKAALEQMDFEVIGALHYDAAVQELTSSGRPSLFCVDLGLPTESGYELCEYIRGPLGRRRAPILVTSDSQYPEDMAEAEEAGANLFLPKPFSMSAFTSALQELLENGAPESVEMPMSVDMPMSVPVPGGETT